MSAAEVTPLYDGPDEKRIEVRVELIELLGLYELDVTIRAVRMFGKGASAPVEIELSNGETMEFPTLRDMARPINLAAEVAACAGVVVKLTPHDAMRAIALVRRLADRHEAFTENEVAIDWGTTYLERAEVLDVDMTDQAERYAAFEALSHVDPTRDRHKVLRHVNGECYVRCGWFYGHVEDAGLSQTKLAGRMARVGWTRRSKSGRIKATPTAPHGRPRGWNFYVVPPGWAEQ